MALHHPSVLLEAGRQDGIMGLFLEGLSQEFLDAAARGDIEDWRKCAHLLVDIVCDRVAAASGGSPVEGGPGVVPGGTMKASPNA